MRVAVMMPRACPWSRRTALALGQEGLEIHVVDFADETTNDWLREDQPFLKADVQEFCADVAGVHLLRSSTASGLKYVLAAPQLRRTLRDCRADLFLGLYGGGYATLVWSSGFRPYALYVVGSDVLAVRGVKRWVARRTLSTASLLLVNGDYLARKTRELVPATPLVPLLLGIDPDVFSLGKPAPAPIRILCTRAFGPVYNNECIIRALALLPADLPNYEVVFTSPGLLLGEMRSLADQLLAREVRERVFFLGGVSHEKLVENYRNSHVFVSMSRSDGTSGALLEALSCGLYPVLSDIPQNREWVNESVENGLLVPLDESRALASALSRAIRDHSARERCRDYNRKQTVERANSKENMALAAGYLRRIVSGRQ
jgi:glycosyltransferase involved in cell wall biosynthesis